MQRASFPRRWASGFRRSRRWRRLRGRSARRGSTAPIPAAGCRGHPLGDLPRGACCLGHPSGLLLWAPTPSEHGVVAEMIHMLLRVSTGCQCEKVMAPGRRMPQNIQVQQLSLVLAALRQFAGMQAETVPETERFQALRPTHLATRGPESALLALHYTTSATSADLRKPPPHPGAGLR